MNKQRRNHPSERMTIRGRLVPDSFMPWISRHAAKLGLEKGGADIGDERITFDISGPEELIDMLEMGCLLGPIDVWVETIDRVRIER